MFAGACDDGHKMISATHSTRSWKSRGSVGKAWAERLNGTGAVCAVRSRSWELGWWGGGQTSHPRRPVHVVGDATTFVRCRSSEVVEAAIIWPADTTETRKELMITNAPSRLLMPGLAADLAAVSLVGATAEASGPSAQLPCSPSSSGAL